MPSRARSPISLLALLALGAGSAACGSAQPLASNDSIQGAVGGCSRCHGSAANPAPPLDAHGNTATSAVGVGAHQSHVTAAHGLSVPLDCVACHVKPTDVSSPGHLDGGAIVTGYTGTDPALAAVVKDPGYGAPTAASASCATSYCHGATLPGQGSNRAPLWTTVDGSQAACGTCHAVPPTSGLHQTHPGGTACSLCHGGVADDLGTTILQPALHVNGKVDVVLKSGKTWFLTWDCSSCHH
jgi:predicted CxxxxCH...CXXCH cytochrome family protein